MSDETDLLEEMKRSSASDFHFFSNARKEERERSVVQEFLSRRSVVFAIDEIKLQEQNSNVDVKFRDAHFQIKEILVPGYRRSAEVEATYRQVMAAKTVQDTIGPGSVYDVPPSVDGYDLVRHEAQKLAEDRRYVQAKGTLDLLLYVTRTRVSLVQQTKVNYGELSAMGWRSISCLMGDRALVLFGQVGAPAFLRHEGS